MKILSLNGTCNLYFYDSAKFRAEVPSDLMKIKAVKIRAEVPGNVELDLSRAGFLPEDLYFAGNIAGVQKYETYDFWYERDFMIESEDLGKECLLEFGGVDAIAEYFVNGRRIGESRNALIPHSFNVEGVICEGANILYVKLSSPIFYAASREVPPRARSLPVNYESTVLRKAPHCFGWDIMPRALSAGLWRDVNLIVKSQCEIEKVYLATCRVDADGKTARLLFNYDLKLPPNFYGHSKIVVKGVCKDSRIFYESALRFNKGCENIDLTNVLLWNPIGYGEPNLYDVTVSVESEGTVVAEKRLRFGIRQVDIEYSETGGSKSFFDVKVNHVKVFVKGTNWVPCDVFHSRDAERLKLITPLLKDIGCNTVRCWGGNVYESDVFFDFCDETGIMVWQDFAMACSSYPNDDAFKAEIAAEAKAIALRLRNHASLITYCGDNECDLFMVDKQLNPAFNKLTREVIPQMLEMWDCFRAYIPSSPYVSEKTYRSKDFNNLPENHLWGARDNYKSTYYKQENVNFIGEIGYHGCVGVSSIENFISKEERENCFGTDWIIHSSQSVNNGVSNCYGTRIELMTNQIRELFGFVPKNMYDYALASQISQAEALKFFIEFTRQNRPRRSGIIWWNLIDGWPQFSDAVVDYYGRKKLAYYYIKRSQAGILPIMKEPCDWSSEFIIDNITDKDVEGVYEVTEGLTGKVIYSGKFFSKANKTTSVMRIPVSNGVRKLFLLKLVIGDKIIANHYINGVPPFNFDEYKSYLLKIAEADGTIDANLIAK